MLKICYFLFIYFSFDIYSGDFRKYLLLLRLLAKFYDNKNDYKKTFKNKIYVCFMPYFFFGRNPVKVPANSLQRQVATHSSQG